MSMSPPYRIPDAGQLSPVVIAGPFRACLAWQASKVVAPPPQASHCRNREAAMRRQATQIQFEDGGIYRQYSAPYSDTGVRVTPPHRPN